MEVDLEGNNKTTQGGDDDVEAGVTVATEEVEAEVLQVVPPPGVQERPRLVSVTVHKSSPKTPVGVGLVDKFGMMCMINSVKPDGLCKDSELRAGMRVYSINGAPVKGLDAAIGMLQVADVGKLTIVAGPPGLVQAEVTKPSVDAKVGLRMVQHGKTGEIVVSHVSGLIAETELIKEGMRVLQVNGVDCEGKSVEDVLEVIAKAESAVTILAYEKDYVSGLANNAHEKAHPHHRPPPGIEMGGEWGSTSRIGPLTWGLAICGILCFGLGWIVILLFLPCDRTDVYAKDGKLFFPNGFFCKSKSDRNFEIRKSEHCFTKPNKKDGRWGSTSYIGPLTWAVAIVALPTVIGAPIVLLFLPMDERDVYYSDGNLYLPNGDFFKTASQRNFFIHHSKHV